MYHKLSDSILKDGVDSMNKFRAEIQPVKFAQLEKKIKDNEAIMIFKNNTELSKKELNELHKLR